MGWGDLSDVGSRWMTMRPVDWCERLNGYLEGCLRKPYDAVSNNCANFALGALEAVSGTPQADILAQLEISLPRSTSDVAQLLSAGGGMRGIAEAYFGYPALTPISQAMRGDLVVCNGDDGEVLGVVEVNGVICLTPRGLARFPISEALGYWSVGQ